MKSKQSLVAKISKIDSVFSCDEFESNLGDTTWEEVSAGHHVGTNPNITGNFWWNPKYQTVTESENPVTVYVAVEEGSIHIYTQQWIVDENVVADFPFSIDLELIVYN